MQTRQIESLSCGHMPSEHSNFTTGTVHLHRPKRKSKQNVEICWNCSDRAQKYSMKKYNQICLYLSDDGKSIDTWSGGKMSVSCQSWTVRHNMWTCPELTCVNMTDHFGNRWYGKNGGKGMFIKFHKVKADR